MIDSDIVTITWCCDEGVRLPLRAMMMLDVAAAEVAWWWWRWQQQQAAVAGCLRTYTGCAVLLAYWGPTLLLLLAATWYVALLPCEIN